MIEMDSVTRSFGNVIAIDNLSIRFSSGQRVALVGPSGAGKTTLLRLINGMLKPDSGDVRVKGYRWGTARAADRNLRSHIGTVYQQFNLVPRLSVARNVQAGRVGRASALRAFWSFVHPETPEIATILSQLGIEDKLHLRSERLSGGEQQRIAIARALFQDPEILLADEPIASVDPSLSQSILDTLNRWALERNATLVVSLHQVEFARQNFERIIGIRNGTVAFDSPPSAVTDAMLHDLYVNENLRATSH